MGTITPHVDWRGAYALGTWDDGSANPCTDSTLKCSYMAWPASGMSAARGHPVDVSLSSGYWMGSLSSESTDGSGLEYKRNRYYDPASGRFTQVDPAGLGGGLNAYGFGGGDQVNYSDPFGLCAEGDWKCELAKALYETTGAIVGGAAGFTGGAAVGVLCGPLVEVCSPAMAVAGAATLGAASAAAAGKAVDSYYDGVNQMSQAGKSRGGNANPNRDVHRLVKEFDLNKAGQRALHDEITGEDMSLDEIRSVARRLGDQAKYTNNPPPR